MWKTFWKDFKDEDVGVMNGSDAYLVHSFERRKNAIYY